MDSPGPDGKLTDEEILREMRLAPDPFVTASELADRTNYTRQGIRNRLDTLESKGLVRRRKVGSRAVVYLLTVHGKERVAEDTN
jgi:DNA-binding MarR family transcriptional regulator